MPRTFTAFVAQTPEPEKVLRRVEDCLGDEYHYERAEPRRNDENRIRIEGSKWFREELREALEAGDLGPVDWAVIMVDMDEAIGVHAWVFDGDELIDTFEGDWDFSGGDTEMYLERFHGVVVDSAFAYLTTTSFDPSVTLAQESPEDTLVDEPPEPPFEITGNEQWTLVVAETDHPEAFREWLDSEFRESGLLLDEGTPTIDRSWVTDGPTTVTFEERDEKPVTRVRARVPLASLAVNEEGINLPFGPGDLQLDFDWIVILQGYETDESVRAWLFLRDRMRFTFGDAVDEIEERTGERGAAVAAYLDRYYGIDIDPTPEGIPAGDPNDVDLGERTPPDRYPDTLEEFGLEVPARDVE